MPTLNEECQRLNREIQAVGRILWNEWRKTAIGRFLVRVLRIEK